MNRLKIKLGTMELKNPVLLASGTAGFGKELEGLVDLRALGGIVTKTITLHARTGNAPPRVVETPAGLLNSIGLENRGLKDFMFEKVPYLETLGIPVIASIAADSIHDFTKLAKELSRVTCIQALEINLSCPNVVHKGARLSLLAQDKGAVRKIVAGLRRSTKLTLIPKLSPNVSDIAGIAQAAEEAGADALALVNTYPGMLIDIHTLRPKLGNTTGGLSGPCIKPMALKCVWDAYRAVKIPLVGIGGIMNAQDAIEFMLCGASAVQVGTANFIDPKIPLAIVKGCDRYVTTKGMRTAARLVGAAHAKKAGV
jgi:dihydroorotate dehydrogenase (NAD+) catalytic subunit